MGERLTSQRFAGSQLTSSWRRRCHACSSVLAASGNMARTELGIRTTCPNTFTTHSPRRTRFSTRRRRIGSTMEREHCRSIQLRYRLPREAPGGATLTVLDLHVEIITPRGITVIPCLRCEQPERKRARSRVDFESLPPSEHYPSRAARGSRMTMDVANGQQPSNRAPAQYADITDDHSNVGLQNDGLPHWITRSSSRASCERRQGSGSKA